MEKAPDTESDSYATVEPCEATQLRARRESAASDRRVSAASVRKEGMSGHPELLKRVSVCLASRVKVAASDAKNREVRDLRSNFASDPGCQSIVVTRCEGRLNLRNGSGSVSDAACCEIARRRG